ncbi:hypothetical protein FOL47_009280, partial [Perkinsus chesapeaki]
DGSYQIQYPTRVAPTAKTHFTPQIDSVDRSSLSVQQPPSSKLKLTPFLRYKALYSANPSVNPFYPGPFDMGDVTGPSEVDVIVARASKAQVKFWYGITAAALVDPMAPVGTAGELWTTDLKHAQTALQDIVRECEERLRGSASGRRPQEGTGTAIAMTRGRISQLRQLHTHLARDLANLSSEPEAHGLTQREIAHRGELLRHLEGDIQRVWASFQSGLHPRGSHDLESGWPSSIADSSRAAATSEGNLVSSEQLLAQQDEHLDYLRGSVSNLKHIGTAINTEIEVHCKLLDEVHEATDHVDAKQKYAHAMLQHHMESTSTTFLWGTIVVLFSILLFVTMYL